MTNRVENWLWFLLELRNAEVEVWTAAEVEVWIAQSPIQSRSLRIASHIDISESSNNIQEKEDAIRQDCFEEQRITAELNVQSPVPISDSPVFDSPEKPEFLRPMTGGMTPQKGSIGRDICDGRITPPPPMISPLPATPAGSMTPVCNTYM